MMFRGWNKPKRQNTFFIEKQIKTLNHTPQSRKNSPLLLKLSESSMQDTTVGAANSSQETKIEPKPKKRKSIASKTSSDGGVRPTVLPAPAKEVLQKCVLSQAMSDIDVPTDMSDIDVPIDTTPVTRRSNRRKRVASELTNGDDFQIEPTVPIRRSGRKKLVASVCTDRDDVQIKPTASRSRSRTKLLPSEQISDARLLSLKNNDTMGTATTGREKLPKPSMEDSSMGDKHPSDDVQTVPIELLQDNQKSTSNVDSKIEPASIEEEVHKCASSQAMSDVNFPTEPTTATRRSNTKKRVPLKFTSEDDVQTEPTVPTRRSSRKKRVAFRLTDGDDLPIKPTVPRSRSRKKPVASQPTSDAHLQSLENIDMTTTSTTGTEKLPRSSMEGSTMDNADPFDNLQIVPINPQQDNQKPTSDIDNQTEPSPLEEAHNLIVSQPSCNGDSMSSSNDVTATFMTDQVFNSRAELCNWVRETGKTVGTVIVINKSDKGYPGKKPRMYIGCERGGRCNQKEELIRHPQSKKCGCPFLLKGIKMPKDDQWMLEVGCGIHNHPVMSEEKKVSKEMVKRGGKSKDIINVLKERNVQKIPRSKTSNSQAITEVNELSRRSKMQQLLKKVHEQEYIEWHRSHEDSTTDLVWAHPESIKLAKCFPHVFLMDAYEQSKYTPPVVEIVGVTSTNKTFSFAFVYMEAEKEDSYVWALECIKSVLNSGTLPSVFVTDREVALMNAIKTVFPGARNLLCRDHVLRDVVLNCKKMFNGISATESWNSFLSRWNDLVFSSTEEEYNDRLSAFEEQFTENPRAFSYVKDAWLSKYKECFIAAWTNQCLHFGNTTINREDKSQERLKRYLRLSQENLNTIWNAIISLLKLQQTEINASFNESLCTVVNDHTLVLFEELKGSTSVFALELIFMELKLANSVGTQDRFCGCAIRHTHGIPCSHEIIRYKHDGHPIPISCIHSHWTKLCSVPAMGPHQVLNYQPEFQMLLRRYADTDEEGKLLILEKLNDTATAAEDCGSA